MAWYWLSFCNPMLPLRDSFIAAVIVEADDEEYAIVRGHELGVDYGADVHRTQEFPHYFLPPAGCCNRLLSLDEAAQYAKLIDIRLRN